MPVFNSAAYVEEALASVQAQEFDDFELVVIDDGSTDGSTEILKAFAAREPRMRLIIRANRGLIGTRNQLLDEARGEFVAWMDSDDLSHPARLRRLVATFDADQRLVCVGSNVETIDPDGAILGVELYPSEHDAICSDQMRGAGFRFPSTMIRRSAALKVGGFREPFRIGEDFDFLLRVTEHGRVGNVQEILYFYRQHLLSTVSAFGVNWPGYRDTILSLARERREGGQDRLQRGETVRIPETKTDDRRKYVPNVLLSWADGALHHGDRRRAFRYTLKAIRAAPSRVGAWRFLMKLLLKPAR
jgi:glycosyltransferase involved in cell wall biosynthesis